MDEKACAQSVLVKPVVCMKCFGWAQCLLVTTTCQHRLITYFHIDENTMDMTECYLCIDREYDFLIKAHTGVLS